MQQYINKPIGFAGIIAFFFVLVATPLMVWVTSTTLAASPIWNGTIAGSYASGSGTQTDPWKITTAEQLARLAQETNANSNNTSAHYYELTQDIRLNDATLGGGWQNWNNYANEGAAASAGIRAWTPIGDGHHDVNHTRSFRANFDGKGFAVYGVYLHKNTTDGNLTGQAACGGLFGVIGASSPGHVRNLGVKSSNIRTGVSFDAAQGEIPGAVASVIMNGSSLTNCYVENVKVVGGAGGAGGLVGQIVGGMGSPYNMSAAWVYNCYSMNAIVTMQGSFVSPTATLGGIAATVGGSLINSYSVGETLTGSGTQRRGSVAGNISGLAAFPASISRCYSASGSGYPAVHTIGTNATATTDTFNTSGNITTNNNGYNGQTLRTALNTWKNNPTVGVAANYSQWYSTPYPTFTITGASFAGGTGTQQSPYLISTKAQLEDFRDVINNNIADTVNSGNFNSNTKFYAMTNDIYLNDTTGWQSWNATTTGLYEWAPIGRDVSGQRFVANFDGRMNAVFGMFVVSGEHVGLFGYASGGGSITNTGVKHGFVLGAGYAAGIVGHVSFPITNCYNTGVNIATRTFTTHTGGIVGYTGYAVSNCYNTANITGSGSIGSFQYLGGIAGYSGGPITDCFNVGAVAGSPQSLGGAGGIVGYGYSVERCYNVGSVTGAVDGIGGIVGLSMGPMNVISCYYNSTAFSGPQIGDKVGNTGALTTSQMLITGTLDMYMTGMGNAWAKRTNDATQSYYPELKVFATDL